MIKVAVLWIANEAGELLLAQRAHHKKQDPSTWGPSVTGKLEPGESFSQALAREVEEELGLTTNDYSAHFLIDRDFAHPDGEIRRFVAYYTVLPQPKIQAIQFDKDEVAALTWLSIDLIREKMQFTPEQLVPSASAVWPDTLRALENLGIVHAQ